MELLTKSIVNFIGFLGGALVGVILMYLVSILFMSSFAKICPQGTMRKPELFLFISSFLGAVLMFFISASIVRLFKHTPTYALTIIYAFALWMARKYRWPKARWNVVFNVGAIIGLIIGSLLFLSF